MLMFLNLQSSTNQISILVITLRRMCMRNNLILTASQRVLRLITFFRMNMSALGIPYINIIISGSKDICSITERITALHNRLYTGFILPAGKYRLRRITASIMSMLFHFRKRTNQISIRIITILIMCMDRIIRISAYQLTVSIVTALSMYMCRKRTAQHPLCRLRLTVLLGLSADQTMLIAFIRMCMFLLAADRVALHRYRRQYQQVTGKHCHNHRQGNHGSFQMFPSLLHPQDLCGLLQE